MLLFSCTRPQVAGTSSEAGLSRRNAMEWFMRKTSIAGTEISNWILVIAALVAIWIIYTVVAH